MTFRKYRTPRTAQPVPQRLEEHRCYCHSLDVPHVHTLADHAKEPSRG